MITALIAASTMLPVGQVPLKVRPHYLLIVGDNLPIELSDFRCNGTPVNETQKLATLNGSFTFQTPTTEFAIQAMEMVGRRHFPAGMLVRTNDRGMITDGYRFTNSVLTEITFPPMLANGSTTANLLIGFRPTDKTSSPALPAQVDLPRRSSTYTIGTAGLFLNGKPQAWAHSFDLFKVAPTGLSWGSSIGLTMTANTPPTSGQGMSSNFIHFRFVAPGKPEISMRMNMRTVSITGGMARRATIRANSITFERK